MFSLPLLVTPMWMGDVDCPLQNAFQPAGKTREPVIKMFQKFLFTQSVYYRRDALRQAEEGKTYYSKKLFRGFLDWPIIWKDMQQKQYEIGEDEDGELRAVESDSPTRSSVAPVQHTQAAPLI